ncbi:hypothetical protein HB848_07615 [Listeria rocourtiae]|uniref:hypothetical protein n=1 Tax=Listeria rocourtiae TaxID=647910 RepID=UPI00162759CF|nr:hypothetical protein [Listeria rocourtiae]MBC1435207.1 hypothetical protein [Listeria rocourtiae]
MKLKVEKLALVIGVLIYIACLYIGYIYLISPSYSYYSLINLQPSGSVKAISIILALIPIIWSESTVTRPSQVVYWLLYILVYIPTMVMPDFVRENPLDGFFFYKLVLLGCLALLASVGKWKQLKIYPLRIKQAFVRTMLYISWFGLFGLIFLKFGFHFRMVNFYDVYDIRAGYHEEGRGTIAAYAMNWQSKIFNPLLMGIGVISKKTMFIIIGIISQFIIFSTTGQKSIAFSTLFILGILWCVGKKGKNFGVRFLYSICLLVMACLALDFILGGIQFTEILTRRLMMVPGVLSSFYYDYFTANPQTHLGYSIFSSFVEYPYDVTPPFLIGEAYFNNLEASANANLWADAFSAFGLWGVAIYTGILAVILWVYDSIAKYNHFLLSVVLLAMPIWSLIDSSLITTFLTHGLLLAIIINYLLTAKITNKGAEKNEARI